MPDHKYLELHGGKYRFVKRVGKKRVQKNLNTDSLTQARKMRDNYLITGSWNATSMVEQGLEWRKAIAEETDKQYSISVLFGDVVENLEIEHGPEAANIFARVAAGELPILESLQAWHSSKNKGAKLKERTKADHRTAITRLAAWMKTRKLETFVPDVTQKVAEDYLDHLFSSEVHPRTGNKALSSTRSMWNFLRVRPNPWIGLALDESNTNDEKERAFTNDELLKLLDGPADESTQAVMRLACLTGARLEELFKLQISDVKNEVLWIVNSKRKGPITKRPVPIHICLLPVVKELCGNRSPTEFLIQCGNSSGWDGTRSMAFSKRFATYRRKVGVDAHLEGQRRSKVNFHSFRRWLATQFESKRIPEIVAARILGHKLETMTYGLYSDGADVEVLQEALNKILIPVTTAERVHAQNNLRQWSTIFDFKQAVTAFMNRIPSWQLFKQPGFQFVLEGWVATQFTSIVECERIRLGNDNWPDFQTLTGENIRGFEVAEVIEPGRERGAESWETAMNEHDYESEWQKRAAIIPSVIRSVVVKKVKKNYPAKHSGLVLYLNIGEWGSRKKQIEMALHDATTTGTETFKDIWVLWKDRLFHIWSDGQQIDLGRELINGHG